MPHPVEGTIMYFSSEHIRGREQISVALEQDHILPLQPLSGVMLLWLGHTLEGLIWAENVGHSVLRTRGSYFMRRPASLNSLPLTPSTSSLHSAAPYSYFKEHGHQTQTTYGWDPWSPERRGLEVLSKQNKLLAARSSDQGQQEITQLPLLQQHEEWGMVAADSSDLAAVLSSVRIHADLALSPVRQQLIPANLICLSRLITFGRLK